MISTHDRDILRQAARRVAEMAALPIQAERRELWKQHNSLKPVRPLILLFPEGAWEELLTGADLACEGEAARAIEWTLRSRIYTFEHFQDDTVVENEWVVHKMIHSTGWGLEPQHIPSTEARGAWKFDPVIHTPEDLKKLHFPKITYDEKASAQELEQAHDLFDGILEVKPKGVAHIGFGLWAQYTDLRGLEEGMMDMLDQPQMVHDAMAFFEAGFQHLLQQYIGLNLLSLNNDSTYHSSGGNGYTDELPAPGFDPNRVRLCDMWASAQSQELAQVGPRQHAEFATAYEKRLLEPFGLTGYGCCEDLSKKLDAVLTIPHIRRISISPFADVDVSARKLQGRAIFSWKPHPSHLVGDFDEDLVRGYIRHTLEVTQANGCVLEMILKDTHTCQHHPERFDRWAQIAREEINRIY
jgi:hypothetical protein